jgi:tetratricopeptide (TPR) repeat protein
MDFSRIPARVVFSTALCAALFGSATPSVSDEILGGKLEKKSTKTEAEIKAAVARLEKQHAADPKNYRVLFDLGNAYIDANDQEKAKLMLTQAIELNPKYVEAMVNLGGLYSDLDQQDDAIKWFQEALKVDPENCKARSNLGNSYYTQQHYPDAMFEYRRAVEKDAKCYSAMYNIAVAFADAGLFRDAVAWWKKVEQLAPGTEAARSARENINILDRFTQAPTPPGPRPASAPARSQAKSPPKTPDKTPQKHK